MSVVSRVRYNRGFSTIELLFAFALATIFISGAALVAFGGQTAGLDMSLNNSAVERTVMQMQKAIASTTQNWYVAVTPKLDTFYTHTNSLGNISACLKKIESTSAWTTEHSRSQQVTLSTYLGSIEEASAQGGACDPFPPQVWDTPASLGSVTASGINGTAIAVRSIAGNTYAFVTAASTTPSSDDFIVVNVTDATNPSIIGSPLNTFLGLNSIVVAGKYAYVLQNRNIEQLGVINISNPANVFEVVGARRTFPNIVSSCSPVTDPCLSGKSIAYYAGRLYIGTSYIAFGTVAQNHELQIYCVDDKVTPGCTPETPMWLGSYNVNHNVNDIALATQVVGGAQKTIAYLATSASSATSPELTILDVTNPSSVVPLGSFNPSGTQYGRSIYVLGNTAYLGRDRTVGANKDFYVLDVTNPALPTEQHSRKLSLTPNTYTSAITVQGNIAFVATTDSTHPLLLFDVTNPTNVISVSACTVSTSQVTKDIVYHENMLFTVNQGADLLRIFYDKPSSCI